MADIWFYTRSGKQMEPVSTAELRQMAAQGHLKPTDMVWREGMPQWIRAAAAKGIFEDPNLNGNVNAYSNRAPGGPSPAGPVPAGHAPAAPVHPGPAPAPSTRPQRSGVHGSGRYGSQVSSPAAQRYTPRKGMKTGTKITIIVGVSLLLGGLAVAAVLLKINSSDEPQPQAAKKGLAEKDRVKSKDAEKDGKKELESFKVFVRGFEEEKRFILLRAGVKYELNVTGEKKPNLYVDDPKGKEVAKLTDDEAGSSLSFTPSVGGQFQVNLTNPWAQDLEFTVAVHGFEIFPFTLASYDAFIRDRENNLKIHDLEEGIRYEFNVTNDRAFNMDLFLVKDGRDVTTSISKPNCFISWVCNKTGKYNVEVANRGVGDINAKVVIKGIGKAPVTDIPPFVVAPPPIVPAFPEIKDFPKVPFPKVDFPKDGFFPPPGKLDFPLPKGLGVKLPAGKLVVSTREGTTVKDALALIDIRDSERSGSFCKVFQVDMVPEKLYTIDMVSAAFDTYLRLVNAAGVEVDHNDDGGGGLNSRIQFRPAAAGTFRIVCTTFAGGDTGPFTLTVREE